MSFYYFIAVLIFSAGAYAYTEAQKKHWAKVVMSVLVLLSAVFLSIFKIVAAPTLP